MKAMLKSGVQSIDKIYNIAYADNPLPLLFDSPHSGNLYPTDFNYSCDSLDLKRAEDNDVHNLFKHVTDHGSTFLHALFPRTYIDVNRAVTDIDTALLSEPWPQTVDMTRRSHAGHGLVRRLLKPGIPLYDRLLSVDEVKGRIENYYEPYHQALHNILDHHHYNYGDVWHVNCHSMPSQGGMGRFTRRVTSMHVSQQPDFVISDRDGTTCCKNFRDFIVQTLRAQGYKVGINEVYKGVEILKRYGSPSQGRHSIQIEINKALYWDQERNRRSPDYDNLKSDLMLLTRHLAEYIQDQLPQNLAAD